MYEPLYSSYIKFKSLLLFKFPIVIVKDALLVVVGSVKFVAFATFCTQSLCNHVSSMCAFVYLYMYVCVNVLFVNGCYLDIDNVAAFFLLLFDDETYFVFECNELSTNGQ